MAVRERGDRRHLRDQPVDLKITVAVVVVDLCVRIEGGQSCYCRNEHPHRVCVVVEAVHELLDVLVDPRVVRDLPGPLLQGLGRGELAADEQVRDLEELECSASCSIG